MSPTRVLFALALLVISSCGRQSSTAREDPSVPLSEIPAISRQVTLAELAEFESGRTLDELLVALNGRGNFEFGYVDPAGDEWVGLSYGFSS